MKQWPVAQPARHIPFHMRQKVASELDNLEQQGIIKKVEGPTPLVSPLIVIPKKNGDVWLCVDMKMANKAIKSGWFGSHTEQSSKLDLCSGYHQISLAKESRYNITTFATHKGLRRYKRYKLWYKLGKWDLPECHCSEKLRDIPGAFNISDDVIVFGKVQSEHDSALQAVIKKFSWRLTLQSANSTRTLYVLWFRLFRQRNLSWS